MFSCLKNHLNSLMDSQRLYYSNYQYYNDYQDLQKDYNQDLSKVIFKCKRKTKTTIFLNKIFNEEDQKQQKMQINLKANEQIMEKNLKTTMDQFLYKFVSIFYQNNYSDLKLDLEENKQKIIIECFKYIPELKIEKNTSQYDMNCEILQKVIKTMQAQTQNAQRIIILLQEKSQDTQFLEVWFAFEEFFQNFLKVRLKHEQSELEHNQFQNMLTFCNQIKYILNQTLNANIYSSLIFSQPYIPNTSQIIHPLLMAIKYFQLQRYQRQSLPKIAFINLDGKQSYFNLRFAKQLGNNFLYVSLFSQPFSKERKQTKMKNEMQSQFNSSFQSINQIYSRLLINAAYPPQIYFDNDLSVKDFSKMLVFPLNSQHIRKHLLNIKQNTKKGIKLQKFISSEEIYFLFQTIIYEELRNFCPSLVFVSYNGRLDIRQDHFNEISKNISIIADHKVIFFPNLVQMYNKNNETKDIIINEEEDEFKQNHIKVTAQFVDSYLKYNWDQINIERFLSNVFTFGKISSGVYSMKNKVLSYPQLKYQIGNKYKYLQCLGKIDQLKDFNKYCSKVINSRQLSSLFQNQSRIDLKENRKQNENYQKLIDSVIFQLENNDQKALGKKIFNKVKQVQSECQDFNNFQQQNQQNQDLNSNSFTIPIESKSYVLNQYFKEKKKRLLLMNLQNYRRKKIFYSDDQEGRIQKTKCFKFFIDNQSEEIYFEKYTQVLFDKKRAKVFIVNYKLPDERHTILHGDLTQLSKNSMIKVSHARESQTEMTENMYKNFQKHNITDKGYQAQKDIIYLNYSYCFTKTKLFLYWPQRWSLRDQVKHSLLQLTYKPENVNILIKVQFINKDEDCVYQSIPIILEDRPYPILPRLGCSSFQLSDQSFYIFGGIYDNQKDFQDIGNGILLAQIKNNKPSHLVIKSTPKKKQKFARTGSANKSYYFHSRLRPKINYRVQKNENSITIFSGFGRQCTNFHNLFSFDSYVLHCQTAGNPKIQKLQKKQNLKQDMNQDCKKASRRLIKMQQPIQVNKVGKYFLISNSQNLSQVQEKFSHQTKDYFVFQTKIQKGQLDINSFLDQKNRYYDFKLDKKNIYLFGYNRTVREKIYTKFWSPQLYIVEGTKSIIVNVSLKTQKNTQYNFNNYLMPRQQDLISLCLQEDSLFVLSCSPIIHSINSNHNKFVLYEGILSNMSQVKKKGQIQMFQRFQFKNQQQKFLKYKTLLSLDEKIYLFGGLGFKRNGTIAMITNQKMQLQGKNQVSYRQDYILEWNKNKYRLKVRKVQSTDDSLQLISPVIVKDSQKFYFYAIEMIEKTRKILSTNENQIQYCWKLKIESFTSENTNQQKIISSQIKIYKANNGSLIRINPRLQQPKFVKISKYQRFNINKFKETLQKVQYRLFKLYELQENIQQFKSKIKQIGKLKEQILIFNQIIKSPHLFKELIKVINQLSQDQDINLEKQELIKDLKQAYSLVNKAILQNVCLQTNLKKKQKLPQQEYKFIIQEKICRKIKYIALGPLNETDLKFIRIRFKYDVNLCLNKPEEEGLFYHPTAQTCQQIQFSDKYLRLQEKIDVVQPTLTGRLYSQIKN